MVSMDLEIEPPSTPTAQSTPTSASCFPCCFAPYRRRSSWWERVRSASFSHSPRSSSSAAAATGDRWWSRGLRALKKLREWSEIVAGPRWKTFIRRFNRNSRACKRVSAKYQYDPLSYALNFDEGQNGDFQGDDAYDGLRNFSTRYASAASSVNSAKVVVSTQVGPAGKDDIVLV